MDDQRTNQAEMDRLLKPCLDFGDDDDDEDTGGEALKLSDLDQSPSDSFGKTIAK